MLRQGDSYLQLRSLAMDAAGIKVFSLGILVVSITTRIEFLFLIYY